MSREKECRSKNTNEGRTKRLFREMKKLWFLKTNEKKTERSGDLDHS